MRKVIIDTLYITVGRRSQGRWEYAEQLEHLTCMVKGKIVLTYSIKGYVGGGNRSRCPHS